MWSKSPATFEELVTRGMSRGDGYRRGCADKLSKCAPSRLPSPGSDVCLEEERCVIVRRNFGFFLKALASSVDAAGWQWGEKGLLLVQIKLL